MEKQIIVEAIPNGLILTNIAIAGELRIVRTEDGLAIDTNNGDFYRLTGELLALGMVRLANRKREPGKLFQLTHQPIS
jgi:hypothetical protein